MIKIAVNFKDENAAKVRSKQSGEFFFLCSFFPSLIAWFYWAEMRTSNVGVAHNLFLRVPGLCFETFE